jgi:Cd2+/Zn2+-exporting ATPase
MNVAISLALKAAFLVMAVGGVATLWMAVLADTGASVLVVGNALRLLRTR